LGKKKNPGRGRGGKGRLLGPYGGGGWTGKQAGEPLNYWSKSGKKKKFGEESEELNLDAYRGRRKTRLGGANKLATINQRGKRICS